MKTTKRVIQIDSTQENDSLKLYMRELNEFKFLTQEDEKYAAIQDPMMLVYSHLKLVVKLAQKYRNISGISIEDIIQEGNIGLIEAAKRFDPSRGTRFSSYATFWILRNFKIAMLNSSRTVRISGFAYEMGRKIKDALSNLTDPFGKEPTDKEIASFIGATEKQVREIRLSATSCVSLNAQTNSEDKNCELGDLIKDIDTDTPHKIAETKDARQRILAVVKKLPTIQADVIILRYGLDSTAEPRTFQEVANKIKKVKSYVLYLERAALKRLKHELRTDDFSGLFV